MTNAFNIETGKRIQTVRCQKGYSRDALSERAGISPGFLGAIEKGEKGMSAQTLLRISQALNVTADYILFGDEGASQRLDCAAQALASLREDEQEAVRTLLETAADFVRKLETLENS